jgi:hypothetical protein
LLIIISSSLYEHKTFGSLGKADVGVVAHNSGEDLFPVDLLLEAGFGLEHAVLDLLEGDQVVALEALLGKGLALMNSLLSLVEDLNHSDVVRQVCIHTIVPNPDRLASGPAIVVAFLG